MKLTTKDVALKAVELADANPDFIYKSPEITPGTRGMCTYVHRDEEDNSPTGEGCLFGQALMALGVDPNTIPESLHIAVAMRDLGIENTGFAETMVSAQGNQDAGIPWGAAVENLRNDLEAAA